MRSHLHHITLRHWDTVMRTLGATALKDLLELGTKEDMDDSITREVSAPYRPTWLMGRSSNCHLSTLQARTVLSRHWSRYQRLSKRPIRDAER
jgi:hypothetical protein